MLKCDLQESVAFPGYYHTPLMEELLISKEGVVIDLRSMYCPIPKVNKDDPKAYTYVHITGHGTINIHRLLALTFLVCPGDPKEYQVNHIDGVKTNYSLDNLEWVTVSGNVLHAYQSGLRMDNRPVLVKDLRTGEVVRHYSLNEAARAFGVNPNKIFLYLNSDDLAPFEAYYTMVYEGDEWKPLTSEDVGKARNGRPKPIVAVMDEGRLVVYESNRHAAQALGMTGALVTYYVMGPHVMKERGISLYCLQDYKESLEDAEWVEDPVKYPKPVAPTRKPTPVNVTDTETGRCEWWGSVEEFAKSVGSSKNTVQKSMSVKAGRYKQFLLKYAA